MVTKSFDELFSQLMGENYMSSTPAQGSVTNNSTATPATSAAPQGNNPSQPTNTPTATGNNQQKEDELMKMLQQKLQDEKFKQQLLQMLNPQQNATPNRVQ